MPFLYASLQSKSLKVERSLVSHIGLQCGNGINKELDLTKGLNYFNNENRPFQ